jgi:hypothetical protein
MEAAVERMQVEMTKVVAERDSLRKEATRMATKALQGRKVSLWV